MTSLKSKKMNSLPSPSSSRKREKIETPIPKRAIGRGGYGQVFQIPYTKKVKKDQKKGDQEAKNIMALKKKFLNPEYYSTKRQRMNMLSNFLRQKDTQQKYFGGLILQDSPRGLIMQNAGVSLDKLMKKIMKRDTSDEEKREFLMDMLTNFTNILEALQFMNRYQLVHGDIKLGNVVWDEDNEKLRLIDYDFMGNQEEYTSASKQGLNYPHTPKNVFYLPWALERYDLGSGPKSKKYLDLIRDNLKSFLPAPWFNQYMEYYRHNGKPQEMQSKLDLYSVGIMAFQIFYNPTSIRALAGPSKAKQEELLNIFDVLIFEYMLNPNPQARHIPLKNWKKLINHLNPRS